VILPAALCSVMPMSQIVPTVVGQCLLVEPRTKFLPAAIRTKRPLPHRQANRAADLQEDHQDAFKPEHSRSFHGFLLSRDGLQYKLSDVYYEPAITAATDMWPGRLRVGCRALPPLARQLPCQAGKVREMRRQR
jgi:hypothetical protein